MNNETKVVEEKVEVEVHNGTWLDKLLLKYLPSVGIVAMILSYLPQLWLTYSTQNVSGQSTTFWALLSFALISTTGQQIGAIRNGLKSKTGLIFQSINLLCALLMLLAMFLFK